MKLLLKTTALLLGLVGLAALVTVGYILKDGLSARHQPGALEEFFARNVRRFVVSRQARGLVNPVTTSANVLVEARAHYADHCAVCHANDGSGSTEMGRGLFPR